MQHIGIVACSAEGAALCYQTICREALDVVGKNDHPRITMDSIPMADWMPSFDAGDLAGVARIMVDSARVLAAREVGAEAQRHGHRRVGVLGTRFTMDGPVYPEALGAMGIEAAVPDAADRETVDRIIFSELVDGIFSDASRTAYGQVIERLADRGCDAVALACTEIPLLVGPKDSALPTLDSTRLLAVAALRRALD
jgi:aspartate racemase